MTNFPYHILRIYLYETKNLILLLFFLNCFNGSVAYECNVFSYLKTIGERPEVTFLGEQYFQTTMFVVYFYDKKCRNHPRKLLFVNKGR